MWGVDGGVEGCDCGRFVARRCGGGDDGRGVGGVSSVAVGLVGGDRGGGAAVGGSCMAFCLDGWFCKDANGGAGLCMGVWELRREA